MSAYRSASGLPMPPDWLPAGGEMARLIGANEWDPTPLGPIGSWPTELRMAVTVCLGSPAPLAVAWGASALLIYNDAYRNLCGARHPRWLGQPFRECWAAAWPAVAGAFDRALAGQPSTAHDRELFIERDGSVDEVYVTFSLSPIRDAHGNVAGVFHAVSESTGRVLAARRARALRDLAARTRKATSLDEVFRLSADALAAHPRDLPFVLMYQLDGAAREARLAATSGLRPGAPAAPDMVPLERASVPAWPLGEVVRAGVPVQVDDLDRKFGPLTAAPYAEPLRRALVLPVAVSVSGQPASILVAGISPRLPLDEAYRGFCELIASAVGAAVAHTVAHEQDRKVAAAERALRDVEQALADADRRKDQLLATLAHELRNPLAPLQDALEIVKLRRGDAQTVDDMRQVMERQLRQLVRLVEDLLDVSRVSRGMLELRAEAVQVSQVVNSALETSQPLIKAAGHTLTVDLPREPVYVHADPLRLAQVLNNLLNNAAKFTRDGGLIAVVVRREGAHVAVSVRDTGVGIPDEMLPQIFEMFRQAEPIPGRGRGGLGIGLTLARHLVELHGGHIRAISMGPDHGSEFTVTLPLIDAPDAVEDTPAVRDEASAESTPSGCRVLIVDDNPDAAESLRTLLRLSGHDADVAHGGEEAVAIVRSRKPDVVLLDIGLPDVDGFEVARRLRQESDVASVRLVAVSGYSQEEDRQRARSAGFDGYLVKPIAPDLLRALMRSLASS